MAAMTDENYECPFCGLEHQAVCDSPGAIVTGTTGCPAHDAKAKERLPAPLNWYADPRADE